MFKVFQVDADDSLEPYDFENAALSEVGGSIICGNCVTEDELIAGAQDAKILWLAWKPGITRSVMEALPNLELAVRWGVGYDQMDLASASELGVAIANAPGYGTIDVAEHVIALMMSASRRVAWFNGEMMAGGWPPAVPGSIHRILGSTLGIIGVGRIGSAVAQRARGLGMEVVGYDSTLTSEQLLERGVKPVSLEQLLSSSDVVSLHVPLNAETGHFMNAEKLSVMKPGAGLINASRGKIVDTKAVSSALVEGTLAWAALDVFEQEPLPADDPVRKSPNVILTPHVAGYSVESWQDLREEMCKTTLDWVRTGWASTIVNPEVRGSLRRDR